MAGIIAGRKISQSGLQENCIKLKLCQESSKQPSHEHAVQKTLSFLGTVVRLFLCSLSLNKSFTDK